MNKRFQLYLLFVCIILSGCSGLSAEERDFNILLLDNLSINSDKLSYSFEASTSRTNGYLEDRIFGKPQNLQAKGNVDRESQQLSVVEGGPGDDLTTFLSNGTFYRKYGNGLYSSWIKMEQNNSPWKKYDYLDGVYKLMGNSTKTITGSERMNGVDYYTVVIIPSPESLNLYFKKSYSRKSFPNFKLDELVKFKMSVLLNKGTLLAEHISIRYVYGRNAIIGKGRFRHEFNMNVTNVGKKIILELPPEVLDARTWS